MMTEREKAEAQILTDTIVTLQAERNALRDAIAEARRRLAKGRALWNGPCHECDWILAKWDWTDTHADLAAACAKLGRAITDIVVAGDERRPVSERYWATWSKYYLGVPVGIGPTPQAAMWDLVDTSLDNPIK